MKKKFLFLPAALLLMGSMAFIACSDDNDNATIADTELTDAESETAHAAVGEQLLCQHHCQKHCRIVHDLHWQTQGRKRLWAALNPKFLEKIIHLFILHFAKAEG